MAGIILLSPTRLIQLASPAVHVGLLLLVVVLLLLQAVPQNAA
jgi:hypothetical protein